MVFVFQNGVGEGLWLFTGRFELLLQYEVLIIVILVVVIVESYVDLQLG